MLAVDNLGSGESDHPDPIAVVQIPLQVEIIHQIITMFREGTILYWSLRGKKYDKVIFAGHSYGSICGNAIVIHHSQNIDALVLIGYSGHFFEGLGPLAVGIAIPAAAAMPDRFSNLNPFYLAQSLKAGRREAFYTHVEDYHPAIVAYDFKYEDTVALEELTTLFYDLDSADTFTKNIFVIISKQNAIVCDRLIGEADCNKNVNNILVQTATFFSTTNNYTVYIPDLTGHSINLHYSAPESFKLAHDYLADRRF